MQSDPYAPPKSEVRDVLPERPSYWIRTGWYYLIAFGGLLWVIYVLRSPLIQGFTLLSVTAALGLSIFLAIWPVRAIAALKSASLPWWWNVLLLLVMLLFPVAAAFEDNELMFASIIPLLWLCGLFAAASLWVEARYAVRVYSTTNSFIFVKLDDLR